MHQTLGTSTFKGLWMEMPKPLMQVYYFLQMTTIPELDSCKEKFLLFVVTLSNSTATMVIHSTIHIVKLQGMILSSIWSTLIWFLPNLRIYKKLEMISVCFRVHKTILSYFSHIVIFHRLSSLLSNMRSEGSWMWLHLSHMITTDTVNKPSFT